MRLALIAALCALGGPAIAQTYNCEPGALHGVECKLSPGDQAAANRAADDARLSAFMADVGGSPAAQRQKPSMPADALDQMTLTKMQAGALIAEGKCVEASGLAGDRGDIALVRAVRAVCR